MTAFSSTSDDHIVSMEMNKDEMRMQKKVISAQRKMNQSLRSFFGSRPISRFRSTPRLCFLPRDKFIQQSWPRLCSGVRGES